MTKKKYYETNEEIEETTDPQQKEKYWRTGFGLNRIDYLEPSDYLTKTLLPEHFAGRLTYQEVENYLVNHYQTLPDSDQNLKERECDIVSTRIASLLDNSGFVFNPTSLKGIHRYLFKDILPEKWVGEFREKNIYKKEPVLKGETVAYANYFMIEDTLRYDFEIERKKDYVGKDIQEIIKSIASFTSSIWQVHPFREGNTRTIAVFMVQYLNMLGFNVNNKPFEANASYFRNALVRANYTNQSKNISNTEYYLNKFYEEVPCLPPTYKLKVIGKISLNNGDKLRRKQCSTHIRRAVYGIGFNNQGESVEVINSVAYQTDQITAINFSVSNGNTMNYEIVPKHEMSVLKGGIVMNNIKNTTLDTQLNGVDKKGYLVIALVN